MSPRARRSILCAALALTCLAATASPAMAWHALNGVAYDEATVHVCRDGMTIGLASFGPGTRPYHALHALHVRRDGEPAPAADGAARRRAPRRRARADRDERHR